MALRARVRRWLKARLRRQRLPIWYHPAYRLPVPALQWAMGIEPRRADLVVWALDDLRLARRLDVRVPVKASLEDLGRVHTPEWLQALALPATWTRILGMDVPELSASAALTTARLACGGTIEAARWATRNRGPTVNLLGGFHHAAPDRGVGLCPVNDVAIAVAALRAEGFSGRVAILDLDAHPPDGTAACLGDTAWIGSLSGSDWGPLPGVDETVLPPGTGDDAYIAALDRLLGRLPRSDLLFVVAGGDVLAGDRMGQLALTPEGARTRDRRVAEAVRGGAAVWLPGGGYQQDAWRTLARTVLVLLDRDGARLVDDPVGRRFTAVSAALASKTLRGIDDEPLIDESDLPGLGGGSRDPRLLGYYTADGIETALYAYGLLTHVRRLGYSDFRCQVDPRRGTGDRFALYGRHAGTEHLLVEVVVDVLDLEPGPEEETVRILLVNWLTLRHPAGSFTREREKLPGQDVPGLGLAWEAGELLLQMARRLGLAGVGFNPAWLHTAYAARAQFRFVDPARQARFETLLRDLGHIPLRELSTALSEGTVRLDGEPYAWEPDLMVHWEPPRPPAAAPDVTGPARFSIERD